MLSPHFRYFTLTPILFSNENSGQNFAHNNILAFLDPLKIRVQIRGREAARPPAISCLILQMRGVEVHFLASFSV